MRFLYLTDPHLSYMDIRSRLDSSVQAGLDKLQWVLSLAETNGIDTIIMGGDIFNAPGQQTVYMNRLITLLVTFKKKGLKIYTVSGNHDVSGGSFDNLKTSALGILINTGVVELLGDLPLEDSFLIRGVSAYERLKLESVDRVRYLVVHGSVNENIGDPPGISEGVPKAGGMYYTSREFHSFFPNLQAIFWGHIHHETNVMRDPDGIWMINPGSLLRCSSAEENNRIPKVAYCDTSTNAFQLHPIAIAMPYSSLFTLESKEIRKSTDFEVGKFMSMVSSSVSSSVNINEIIFEMLRSLPPEDQSLIKSDLIAQGFSLDAPAAA